MLVVNLRHSASYLEPAFVAAERCIQMNSAKRLSAPNQLYILVGFKKRENQVAGPIEVSEPIDCEVGAVLVSLRRSI